MPALGMLNLPIPSDCKEFESMVKDYFQKKYGGLVQLYGRTGQKQNGLDIILKTEKNNFIGIQSKDYLKTDIKEKDIDNYIRIVEDGKVNFRLDKFVIAIAKDNDVNLQNHIHNLSQTRVRQNRFDVEIIFWPDINSCILENEDLLKKYYGDIFKLQLETQDSILVENEEQLLNKFIELYNKYRIIELMNSDLFTGIEKVLIVYYDDFNASLNDLLVKSIMLSKTDLYKDICCFFTAIDNYVCYMSRLADESNEIIYKIIKTKYTLPYMEKYKKDINERRDLCLKYLNNIISKI